MSSKTFPAAYTLLAKWQTHIPRKLRVPPFPKPRRPRAGEIPCPGSGIRVSWPVRTRGQGFWSLESGFGNYVHYILYLISVTDSICLFSIVILNRPCSVTNTKCKPTIILSSILLKKIGLYGFMRLQIMSQSDFHSKFQSWMTMIPQIVRI